MTHFDDLSACDYFGDSFGPFWAVGWLEPEFEYAQGAPGQAFYDALRHLFEGEWSPINFLGWEDCGFCRYGGPPSFRNLFVPGQGKTYAAPEGIMHYIAAHGYCPPAEFCSAVLACPPVGTPAYFEALQMNGWPGDLATDYEKDLEWHAQNAKVLRLVALGDILVTRIEMHHTERGQWPDSLQQTEELTPDLSAWEYEVAEQGFRLQTVRGPGQDALISWDPKHRTWREHIKDRVVIKYSHLSGR